MGLTQSYEKIRVVYDAPKTSDSLEIDLRTAQLQFRCERMQNLIEKKEYYGALNEYNVVHLHSYLWTNFWSWEALKDQRNKARELDELYVSAKHKYVKALLNGEY